MANKKISQLDDIELVGGTSAAGLTASDIIPVTDVSDTTGSNDGTTKKVTVSNLMTLAPVQTADIANFSSAFYSTVSETTTSRTLSDSDNGKVIVCTNAATITVTIPSTLTAGFSCKLVQGGAGIVGVVAGSGTTLSLIGGKSFTTDQYQVVDVINYATNAYVLDSIGLQTDPSAFSGNTYSIDLDGVSDHASFTQTDFTSTARSWSFWYKLSSTAVNYFPFMGSDTANDYILLQPGSGYFYINSGNGTRYSAAITQDTTNWHNFIVTDNGSGTINMYFDGSSTTVSGTATIDTLTLKYIGRGIFGSNTKYFPGKIDEVAYFPSVLSSTQVTNIYKGEADGGSGGTNGTAGDLTSFSPDHWWRMGDFEGGTGSTVKDQGAASTTLDLSLNGATFDGTDAP